MMVSVGLKAETAYSCRSVLGSKCWLGRSSRTAMSVPSWVKYRIYEK